ncbi:VCBS repeat-containing protein [Streptomyces sp. JHA26]|uniref:FG-GAP repeat domain-containing protein n=1 Tax=Streptomyces sp. JHA26 TaxID=1917143 RepID=UPI00098A34C1|nr:VCBS repeat-containing protein [Streptomyces sp. JHA26]
MLLGTPAVAADKPSPDVDVTVPKSELPRLDRVTPKAKRQAPRALVAAAPAARFDVDGDGYTDMLMRLQDGATYVWRTTTGEFTPYVINVNDYEEKQKDIITPGDVDGEGGPEVFTLSQTGTLSLFQSWGVDNTGYSTWNGTGWQIYNKVIAPGDVTGDGRPDLLARTYAGDLYLYAGTGNVSSPLRGRVRISGGWSMFDQLVGMGDMNGDGIGDVVGRTPAGDLFLYAGRGGTTSPLTPRQHIGQGWTVYNQIVAGDDWDGDGLGDLLGRTPSGALYYYRANGRGGFDTKQQVGTGFEPVDLFAGSGAHPHLGKSSLLGLDAKGTLYWYGVRNNGLLTSRSQVSDTGGWAGARIGYASSLDNDGNADLLELYNGVLYNYASTADEYLATGWGKYNLFLGPGDLNDDGKGDLLARDTSGTLFLFRGKGHGASLSSPLRVGGGWNAYNKIVGAGDFTGDGRADIVARTPAGQLYLYRGTGVSTSPLAGKVYLGSGWQQYNKLISPGDIDGDGRADLLAANSKGELFRYSSYSNGRFKARVKAGTGWNTYRDIY